VRREPCIGTTTSVAATPELAYLITADIYWVIPGSYRYSAGDCRLLRAGPDRRAHQHGNGRRQDTSIGSIFAAGDRSAPPLVSFVVGEGDRDTDWDRVTLDVRRLCSCTRARRNGRLLMHCR
jgi:hypothetical protein